MSADVAVNSCRAASDLLNRRIELRLAPTRDDNRCALECETVCGREADAGGAAGNESDLAFVLRGVRLVHAHGSVAIPTTA